MLKWTQPTQLEPYTPLPLLIPNKPMLKYKIIIIIIFLTIKIIVDKDSI